MSVKFDKRTKEVAHKLYFLALEYPDHDIMQLSQIFQTSPIEFNTAAWAAQDLGYLKINADNSVEVKELPKDFKWEFGELVDHLLEVIPYALSKINAEEADIEENYFGNWTAGYPAHDVMIAMRRLEADGVIASYKVNNVTEIKPNREQRRKGAKEETVTDTYTFYTMAGNEKHRWGEKQFNNQEQLQKDEA